jgi:hypothetical protein
MRGFFSLTHLGSRRRKGLVPRAAADRWGGVRGGDALVLGKGKEVAVVRCGGPGSGRPLFIGGERQFGRGFFLSSGSFEGSTMAGRGKYPAVDPLPARLRPESAVGQRCLL